MLQPLSGTGELPKSAERIVDCSPRAELARAYRVAPNGFHARLMSGWSIAEALGIAKRIRRNPEGGRRKIAYDGVTYNSVTALAKAFDIFRGLVFDRFRLGWSPEEAVGLKFKDLEPYPREARGAPLTADYIGVSLRSCAAGKG